jgi:hypothetical protein
VLHAPRPYGKTDLGFASHAGYPQRLRAVEEDRRGLLDLAPLRPRVQRLRCFRGIDDLTVIAHAWAAQQRRHRRYARWAARGKPKQHVVTAVARELTGFVWAALTQ